MRCGACATPCPPCPQSLYVDQLAAPLVFAIGAATTTRTLLTRTVSFPAGIPLGVDLVAEFDFCLGDQNDTDIGWGINMDGTPIQGRAIVDMEGSTCESAAVVAGVDNVAPGDHTFELVVSASVAPGSGTVTVIGASMRTELVAADSLTVTP